MLNFLTQEQKRILKELDRIVDFGAKPKRTYLKKSAFKIFRSIMSKKERRPAAVADIELIGDVYRGIQVCEWPPK